jgi:L-fuculose-phosphate aldolase
MTRRARESLVATARAMNESGLNLGTSGNLSLRAGDGMLITPSGVPYPELGPGDVVFVDTEGRSEGGLRPSSEWRFHLDIYRARPEAAAIVHEHPVHCTALACLNRPLPAFHYMVAVAGGRDIRCAPYATFGTQELSDHVLAALDGRRACLMANHGLLCFSSSLARALDLALQIEHLAESYLACLAVAEPVVLDDEEMDRVLLKFEDYGPRKTG